MPHLKCRTHLEALHTAQAGAQSTRGLKRAAEANDDAGGSTCSTRQIDASQWCLCRGRGQTDRVVQHAAKPCHDLYAACLKAPYLTCCNMPLVADALPLYRYRSQFESMPALRTPKAQLVSTGWHASSERRTIALGLTAQVGRCRKSWLGQRARAAGSHPAGLESGR